MTSSWFLVASLLFTFPSLGQSHAESQAVPVVTVSPACPEMASKPGLFKLPVIHIGYDPSAPGATLLSPQSLTLYIASVVMGLQNTVHDQPLTRQADGQWVTDFDPPTPFGWGYFVFYFEDQQHHVDRNHGTYWDIVSCLHGQPSAFAVVQESNTWLGNLMAPGMQRPRDIDRAITVLKADLAQYPDHVEDYYFLWSDELTLADNSPAGYEQVAHDINDYVARYGNEYSALVQIAGFVAANQAKLPTGTVERFRKAAIALPQTEEPMEAWRNPPRKVPRTQAWMKRMETDVHNNILGELDFWPIQSETDPRKQAADFLAYAAEYPNGTRAGSAYLFALEDEESPQDMAGVENVEAKWWAWDPKNPDPPAVLAHYYLDEKIKLDSALQLLNQSQALFDAAVPANAASSSRRIYDKGIKSRIFREVAPSPADRGNLAFLRGQVYLQFNKLPQARADLEAAAKAMPDKPEIQFALGQVCEKMGDRSQALAAYLAAASALNGSTQQERDSYDQLFVTLKLGSKKDAEKRLFARIQQSESQAAVQYVPVVLNQPAPPFSFQALNGKTFDNGTAMGRDAVIDIWSVWCAPCTMELPGLLKFQKLHPKVDVMAIAIDDKPQEVRDYLASHGLRKLRVAVAPEIPKKLASSYPTTVVLDSLGHVQFTHYGFLPDAVTILDKDLDTLQSTN